ncbi:bifunctional precorrin-2 dehydrogenase/sirohydrochlorin ferrochelatase [Sebaldella sp. S0638]|uniref:precorrin-2 dehydrogenase/sirohydrochlorin ferrochelatase family protein n=1 Tax=Sebaldella sp. S0638 TaxID=2957809 RepID=UPI00209CB903|nr:NAD(P)-dependent oxidoreductase [Sebaldella sp. S0638]MCP1224016.1 bifunctional precorrin-2 dehydrogenase/sirohydrochlorin ferrochelatase [Sebaldella sp. S0638]
MFFPVCIDIENKKCLVVGGGKIAYKKIKTLSRYNPDITVIAEEIKEEKIKEIENINIIEKRFSGENLKEYMLVVAATDNKELNEKIAEFCINNNILVNNITSKENMNARFGAILENEDYQILVSSHGKNCKNSKNLRDKIKNIIK